MTSKTDAWMPLWIGAYLADTQHLSRDQHGGYLLLLMAYWRNKGPLADSDDRLAAIVRASKTEWKKLRPVLAEFFTVESGLWTHKRADQELERASVNSKKAADKAKKAADARWGHPQTPTINGAPGIAPSMHDAPGHDAPSIPQALPEDCPTPTPIPGAGNPAVVAKDQNQDTHTARATENPGSIETDDGDFLGPNAGRGAAPPVSRILGSSVTYALGRAGMQRMSPSHPKLLALVEAGATVEEFTDAWEEVKGKDLSNPFTYVLGMVEGRRKAAAGTAGQLHTGPLPPRASATPAESFRERDARLAAERMAEFAPNAARKLPGQPIEHPKTIIDMEPPYAIAHQST